MTTVSGRTASSGGCGCGGGTGGRSTAGTSGGRATGSCGCGGSCGGGTTSRSSSFVRPRFFGGMLLAEDDLQAIDDYMLAKRRLTNRSVFGAGVVCGLEVGCDRCESGSVLVSPGYALDCCGNDIVVDCPEEVDVVALVRELRDRQGIDCGEPCAKHPRQEYVLNIVYAEQPTDPVAPYAADDCAVGDCEFSRVREGYRFELSCEAAEAEPTIVDVLEQCLDIDDERSREEARAMSGVVELAMSQSREEPSDPKEAQALAEAAGGPVEEATLPVEIPRRRDFDTLDTDGLELEPGFRLVARTVSVLSADAAGRAEHGRGLPINAERRSMLRERSRALAQRLLASDELATLPVQERERVTRILNTASGQDDLAAVPEADRAVLGLGFTAPEAEEAYVRDATMLRSRVLRGLAESGRAGCREYRDVASLRFDRLDERAPTEARILGRAFLSLFARCLCSAANPPCPTCTDVLVPLARVRVEGCDVISVCDLERHWVHSPRALAYWFPVVEAVREVLEARCCPEERYEKKVVRERELDVLGRSAMAAGKLVRPPEQVPALRQIMTALGDQFLEHGGKGFGS